MESILHHNPVYGGYFADPFVWQHDGAWYAVGTGEFEAHGRTVGRIFPLLQSNDFIHWHFARSALMRPDKALGTNFWAPSVAFAGGRFYLYYSVGFGEQQHRLRVASSIKPTGPYEDLGVDLVPPNECPFAIDPHPFQDEDGRWYLFFARDFLAASPPQRVGTGLVVAPMKTMTELESPVRTVLRARSDWQRFEADRPVYGQRFDWHTLEGPCVVKRDGLYYCFFSGGRWENESYGVDYAVADSVTGPYSDEGNESGPRVLKTVPDRILGPGHNTIAKGPDGKTDCMVYHAWDAQKRARRMFVDRLEWTAEGPKVEPTLEGKRVGQGVRHGEAMKM